MRTSLIALLFPLLALQAFAQEGGVDSLLQRFDRQQPPALQATALALFRQMEEDDFPIDQPGHISNEMPADSVRQWVWYWAGEYLYDRQRYDEALAYALRALPLCAPGSLVQSDCKGLIAILYFRQAHYPLSLTYAREALEADRAIGDKSRISSSLNTLAGICLAARQPEEGERYILEAMEYSRQAGDSARWAIQSGMASEICHALGREEQSLGYARQAYRLDSLGDRRGKQAIRLSQMATALIALQRHAEAEAALRQAIPVFEQVGNRQSLAISLIQLGTLCVLSGRAEQAVPHFRTALDICTAKGDLYNACKAHYGLGQALRSSAPHEANDHLLRYAALKDTLYERGMESGLNQYNALYKNDLLQEMHRRERSQRWYLLGLCCGVIVGLAIFSLATLYSFRRHRRRMQLRVEQLLDRIEALQSAPSAEVARAVGDDPLGNLSPDDRRFIDRFTRLVTDCLPERPVDLSELASELCITRSQLNRRMKSVTGLTSSAYVTALRVAKAKELLASPDVSYSVAEVASLCGIEDVSYFIALFKRSTGFTPKQWRNEPHS